MIYLTPNGISFIFLGLNAKDLFNISKATKLLDIKDAMEVLEQDRNDANVRDSLSVPMTVQPSVATSDRITKQGALRGSGLLQTLQAEKTSRMALNAQQTRFAGVYSVKSVFGGIRPAADESHTVDEKKMLVRNPFSTFADTVPQANRKRAKKNVTFIADDDVKVACPLSNNDPNEQMAGIVVASLVQHIMKHSLTEFAFAIKNIWRRDSPLLNKEDDLIFFHVSSVFVKYRRLQLQQELQKIQGQHSETETLSSWEPDLQAPLQIMDRMTINRAGFTHCLVLSSSFISSYFITFFLYISIFFFLLSFSIPFSILSSFLSTLSFFLCLFFFCLILILPLLCFHVATNIETLKGEKKYDQIVHPMELFKEIIASTRFFLLSSIAQHHEIAIGTLTRIFYTSISTERMDPLPALLRDWKPGTYGRKHLHVLLEMVHETLKTLDEAKSLFIKTYSEGSHRTFQSNETQQNLSAGLRFEPEEYFRRFLLTPNTIALYTRVLENYATNPPWVNHYAYFFLRRVCSQKVEVEYNLSDSMSQVVELEHENELTLAYMLFNVQSLLVFCKILNEPNAVWRKQNDALVRLIKSIVRVLGNATKKNHLIYTELLLQHPHSQQFCRQLDSVYEAQQFASLGDKGETRSESNHSDHAYDDELSVISEKQDNDYGDEFDEAAASQVKALSVLRKEKKSKKQKLKKSIVAKYNSDGDTNSDYDSGDDDAAVQKRRKASNKANIQKPWSRDEDAILREKYHLYSGSRGVYDVIAQDELISSCGRTATDVENRVKLLKLSVTSSSTAKPDSATGKENVSGALKPAIWDGIEQDDDEKRWSGKRLPIRIDPISTSVPHKETFNRKISKKNIDDDDDDDDDLFGNDNFDTASVSRPKSSMIIDSDED